MANAIDAHMPPQPLPEDDDPVWGNTYNPETNEWAPSSEQHSTFGVAEPSHGDEPDAAPSSEQYGRYDDDGGTTPDARLNLLSSIRGVNAPLPAPPIQVQHVVTTETLQPALVRARSVVVAGNTQASVLLEENPNRKRALIRVFTAASTILVSPLRQGGVPQLVAPPTTPGAFFPLSTADAQLEVKSGAGVEAVGITAAGVVIVSVWEEMDGPGNHPGLT